jgi:hypothetical protein
LENKVTRKKADNGKKQAGVKQNQLHKGKQDATGGYTRKKKWKVTLRDTSDSEDDFEEHIIVKAKDK